MVAKTLIDLRLEKRLSQSHLAGLIGVSQSMIQMIESGQRRPSPEVAQRIADLFGLTRDQMWDMFYTESAREVS